MAVDKNKIIASVLAQIKAELPDELVGTYEDMRAQMDYDVLSTGSIAVDVAIGGGFPIGRLINLVGHSSSGKTTLALTAVATLQKQMRKKGEEPVILYIDAENSLDLGYAAALGVDVDAIHINQPDNGEAGYRIAELFINSGVCDLVVVDSIAALIPKILLETELGEQGKIGAGATLDSQGIGRIFNAANKTKTTVIMINQWKKAVRINQYEKGDGLSGNYYQSGGQNLPFYMSQMIEISRVGKLDQGGEFTSDQIRARIFKNKIGAPHRQADFYITYGEGLDRAQELMDFGLEFGFIEKTGRSIFEVVGHPDTYQNGRQAFVEKLKTFPEVMEELSEKVKAELAGLNVKDLLAEDREIARKEGDVAASAADAALLAQKEAEAEVANEDEEEVVEEATEE